MDKHIIFFSKLENFHCIELNFSVVLSNLKKKLAKMIPSANCQLFEIENFQNQKTCYILHNYFQLLQIKIVKPRRKSIVSLPDGIRTQPITNKIVQL